MSSAGKSTLQTITDTAAPIVETMLDIAFPGSVTMINAGIKLAQGIEAGLPAAQALWAEINSDTPPTAAELAADIADENSAFNQVMADIDTKLAAP